jgi:hypothetical protein
MISKYVLYLDGEMFGHFVEVHSVGLVLEKITGGWIRSIAQ